jgi:hypothetical protein
MYFIVHTPVDGEYMAVEESYVIFSSSFFNFSFDEWNNYVADRKMIPNARCLKGEDSCECIIIQICEGAYDEEDPVLTRIKRIIIEKKSSVKTILDLFPRIRNGRSRVVPMAVSLFCNTFINTDSYHAFADFSQFTQVRMNIVRIGRSNPLRIM